MTRPGTGSVDTPHTDFAPPETAEDRALIAALQALPEPAVPSDLAARIMQQVPRLPQLPADMAPPHAAVLTIRAPLGCRVAKPAPEVALPTRPRRAGRALAGLATMAAGLAVLAWILPLHGPVAPVAAPVPALAAQAVAPAPVEQRVAVAAPAPVPVARHRVAVAAAAPAPELASAAPAVVSASVPAALPAVPDSVALPPRGPLVGPVDTADAGRALPTALGTYGPSLDQGYGFVGGGLGQSGGPAGPGGPLPGHH